MKNNFAFLLILTTIFLISCDQKEIEPKTGTVVFGANYGVINWVMVTKIVGGIDKIIS